MEYLDAIFNTYLVILGVCVAISYVRYRALDRTARIISLLITVTLISECLASYYSRTVYGKDIVYHFYSIIELFLTSLYFLYCNEPKETGKLIVFAAIVSIASGGLNMLVQPLNTLNSNMLIFESICVIGMSLFSLYRILLDENITRVARLPRFWITVGFLFYWCYTFFFWAFFMVLVKERENRIILLGLQGIANILLYIAISVSFLMHPKSLKT